MKSIKDIKNLKNKKVFLRVDFNVAIKNGKAKEIFKIKSAKDTLDFLVSQGANVALASHLGRPEGKNNPEFSLEQIRGDIENALGRKVKFVSSCVDEEVKKAQENQEDVLLLENLRFHAGEKENDEKFAEKLSENFDFYVNDAFGVSHRDQASITGITRFLESFAGINLEKEIKNLSKIREDFEKPAVAIIGGAKIETKLPVIKFFEGKYNFVLVGGKVANEAIDSKEEFSEKVILPDDFEGDRFDIGKETRAKFKEIIKGSKTIVWNGPLGMFEKEEFSKGTEEIFEAIKLSDAFKIAGGGETLEIIEKNNAFSEFNFVSTGGGAMLQYIEKGTLPGIGALD